MKKFYDVILMMALIFVGAESIFWMKLPIRDSSAFASQEMIIAKTAYQKTLSEAKKFSPDSYLVNLNTTGVQKDGKSNTWYIFFCSPSRNMNFKVNVVDGKVEKTSDTKKNKTVEIAGNWIDSDQAAEIAVSKCDAVYEDDYFIDLDIDKDGKTPIWNFKFKVGEDKTLTIVINAQTGEYIKTRKSGIGW
jgi:hypothetical protein